MSAHPPAQKPDSAHDTVSAAKRNPNHDPNPNPTPTPGSLWLVLFTIFLDLIGIGILFPVIPLLLGSPDSPSYLLPPGMPQQTGYLLLGLLTAVYPIGMFFAAPLLGQLSDRYGRRPVLALSIGGTAFSYVLFAIGIYTRNIPLLFASRLLDGVTGGNISVAQAAIADVSTPQNRAKNFGLMGAVFGLGFVIGPFIGGKLADPSVLPWFNAATPFWFAALLAALNMISILWIFRETNAHMIKTGRLTWDKSIRDIVRAVSMKDLRVLFLVTFLFNGGFTFFTTFFGVFLVRRFGYTEGDIGNFFAYVGVWIMITQALITRQVAKFATEKQVLNISLTATGLFFLLYILPDDGWWLLFVVPPFAVVNGLTQANFMALLSRSASPKIQGEVLGINASVASLSQAIAPILSGFVAVGVSGGGGVSPESSIVVACILTVIAGLLFTFGYRGSSLHAHDEAAMHPMH
jgi:MFS transporter, DHA1 family, tetracycline resistance protein